MNELEIISEVLDYLLKRGIDLTLQGSTPNENKKQIDELVEVSLFIQRTCKKYEEETNIEAFPVEHCKTCGYQKI